MNFVNVGRILNSVPRSGFLACLVAAAAVTLPATGTSAAGSKIYASYKIHLNGMYLGKFQFNSRITANGYTMNSDTKLSMPILGSLFQSLTWRGQSRSSGDLVAGSPRPNSYAFNFKSGNKRGSVKMSYRSGRVASVSMVPNRGRSPKAVPVKAAHLRGVMDPMSAVMMFSRRGNSQRSVCNRTVPVFDGKQRFNLKLSYRKTVRLSRSKVGYSGTAVVCRVKYQPISGYKPRNKQTRFFAKTNGIELWLIPLPKSRSYVPIQIVLPTPAGTAYASAEMFQVVNARGRRIALIRN